MSANPEIALRIADHDLRQAMHAVCRIVQEQGGRAYLVGGCVRDAVLRLEASDLDFEVFDVAPGQLQAALADRFKLDLVGKAFGVIKLKGLAIDVGLPRREFKTGRGHTGFTVDSDPTMSVEQAAARRDFTINAIYLDPLTQLSEDPFGGRDDLHHRVLRHTSSRFEEDPLRVLRGAQFAARFELTVDVRTIELCRRIDPEGLAAERIFEEWRKLLLYGKKPSLGLNFLRNCGWIDHFPEIKALIGLQQDPRWHPEGDAWTHTLMCLDAYAEQRIGDDWEDLVVGLAVLCHDFGKATTTRIEGGRIRSLGHDTVGTGIAEQFLRRLTPQRDLATQVIPLVANHMKPQQLYSAGASSAAIRRLAGRVGRIDRLIRVAQADAQGRSTYSANGFPAGDWLLTRASELEIADQAPQPLILGRHLMALGLKPGPHFNPILKTCYDAQLDGEFMTLEAALEFLERFVAEQDISD